jgi:hypothetical protein
VSCTSEVADWRLLVLEGWPAVAASDLLQHSHAIWLAEGLMPPNDDEAVAMAAMGRLVRYGQSIAVNLPLSRDTTLPRLAYYLHRLRLDAAQGLVRSTWLNRVEMAQRCDLLVFGRPRRMLRDFVTSTVMRPVLMDANKSLDRVEFQRTVLVDGHGDLLNTLEVLEQQSRPFAILVDVSVQGCDENAVGLIRTLPTVFPKVPIVAFGFTGQVLEQPLGLHSWNVRLADGVRLTGTSHSPNAKQVELVAPRDSIMNTFVKRLGFLVWNLKRMVDETGGRSPEFTALLAVDRALRCLNVPLAVHEEGTARCARGGRFAVRSIESWLDIASRMRGRRGDVQALLDEILKLIQNNLKELKTATPGRSELLLQLGAEAIKHKKGLSILLGNKRDALVLQNWLEEKLGANAIDLIAVSAMDGSTAVPPDHPALVVYAAPLFPSRLHWLGVAAKRKVVLCHPFEKDRVLQQVDVWWRANALRSAGAGDKSRLWRLDWSEGASLPDLQVEVEPFQETFVAYTELAIDGLYPKPLRVAQLEISRRFDDWLQAMLEEPSRTEGNDEKDLGVESNKDVVILHLERHSEPLRWPAERQVMRLDGDTFSACPAREILEGNELVLLGSSEERLATQREIFDMFVQNHHGLQQTLRVAEKWQEFVDQGVSKLKTVAELTRYLKSKKFDITAGAVQHWYAGRVIGPHDPVAIRILAELAEVPSASQMAKMVENAIHAIRNEHRKIGGDLRKAITLTRGRNVSAVQIGSRCFSREVFDAMVEVCRVVQIERPTYSPVTPLPGKTVRDVARRFAARNSDKIVFTNSCERSMARSVFEDLDAFEAILKVIVEGFHPMYSDKNLSLKQVEDMLAVIPASYAGNMSDITKGKFESHYWRQHDGQKVDISRHIKLGRSFDQRHTLRLYFHWDAKAAKIVIHHAGEHLPTLNS